MGSSRQHLFLLFPTTLFKLDQLPLAHDKSVQHFLIEEPIYFGHREQKMNFNQLKLVLHRASMKYYQDYLKQQKINLSYHEYKDLLKDKNYNFLKQSTIDEIHIFDPVDHLLLKKLELIAKFHQAELIIHQNPNFLTPVEDLEKYAKGKKKYFHHHFYEWQKKRMNLLKNIKSKDSENRAPPPKNLSEPDLPENPDLDSEWVKEAIKYVKRTFPKNYGRAENFIYPITHQTSEKWFQHFLKTRFKHFGKYQDAMVPGKAFLYHSVITPMLNIGLLDPQWIVDECTKYYRKEKLPLNNYEGYLRQVIGWREYSRFLYLVAYQPIKNGNYFKHSGKLNSKWYQGKTGIEPIDATIKMAFDYGYLHHILRLMMMSNFMNLCQLHPDQVYRWFMEFSCDSYDWVMTNNVYSMGLYADGGLTMRKPYLSTSNYILKMSLFEKDGHWDQVWNTLYYYFLYDKKDQLKKTAMVRNLHLWDKKTKKEQDEIKKHAQKIIKDLTN